MKSMPTLPEDFWVDPVTLTPGESLPEPPGVSVDRIMPDHLTVALIPQGRGIGTELSGTPKIARNSTGNMIATEVYVRCANGHPALMFSIKCRDGECYGACPVCGWKEKR